VSSKDLKVSNSLLVGCGSNKRGDVYKGSFLKEGFGEFTAFEDKHTDVNLV